MQNLQWRRFADEMPGEGSPIIAILPNAGAEEALDETAWAGYNRETGEGHPGSAFWFYGPERLVAVTEGFGLALYRKGGAERLSNYDHDGALCYGIWCYAREFAITMIPHLGHMEMPLMVVETASGDDAVVEMPAPGVDE